MAVWDEARLKGIEDISDRTSDPSPSPGEGAGGPDGPGWDPAAGNIRVTSQPADDGPGWREFRDLRELVLEVVVLLRRALTPPPLPTGEALAREWAPALSEVDRVLQDRVPWDVFPSQLEELRDQQRRMLAQLEAAGREQAHDNAQPPITPLKQRVTFTHAAVEKPDSLGRSHNAFWRPEVYLLREGSPPAGIDPKRWWITALPFPVRYAGTADPPELVRRFDNGVTVWRDELRPTRGQLSHHVAAHEVTIHVSSDLDLRRGDTLRIFAYSGLRPDELVRVREARVGLDGCNELVVVRGFAGTTASGWGLGTVVEIVAAADAKG